MGKYLISAALMLFTGLAPLHAAMTPEDGDGGDSLLVMFWNLENFFDYRDGGANDADHEFSSAGERHWSKRRFLAKCSAVAKAILWTGGRCGRLPDVIGLAEIENRFVLWSLLQRTLLYKLDYRIVHFDSPDPRGIDVALLYRNSVFELAGASPVRVTRQEVDSTLTQFHTRDILAVTLKQRRGGALLGVLVNHHPSKYGGAILSQGRRRTAMERLRASADSLSREGVKDIVAIGDFNDTPDRPLFRLLVPLLEDKSRALLRRGEGTIRYDGRWELIDLCFVSDSLSERSTMDIVRPPFLIVRDKAHAGEKPLRTYSGPRYIGGVSDHLPIILKIVASRGSEIGK